MKNKKNIVFSLLGIGFALNAISQSDCETKQTNIEKLNYCQSDKNLKNTTIDALTFKTLKNGVMQVDGGVCVRMGEQTIMTQELLYNDLKKIVTIDSELTYLDPKQTINAKKAKINLDTESAILENVIFQLNESSANGASDTLKTDKSISRLTNLIYTTCPKGDKQWYIKAESADLDQESNIGTFRKMSLRFKGIPLLYFPYAKMPLSDQRKSGFLVPEIGNSSNNGFKYAQPYYINIAPNMDATITPGYFSKRGATVAAQFRYLGDDFKGEVLGDYLPSDRLDKIDRGFVEVKHSHLFGANWLLNSHLRHVSDNDYYEDFGNNSYASSQAYLYSFLTVQGFGEKWRFNAQLNDYQIISDAISLSQQPYQTLPRLDFSWFNNDFTSPLNYGVDSSWVNFHKEASITSTRLDIKPFIEKTFQNNYSRLTPKLYYRYTSWDYSDTQFSTITNLENSRSLPIASVDYRVDFEKQFNDGSFSTIEPRLYYLYSPYRKQQNIPLFDTHELTFGTGLLYQTNAFSGVDRQSDANQISLGVTQRHFDNTGTEKWNLTIGQIAHFDDRRVQLDNVIETRSTSPIITEFNYFYRNWKVALSVHWDQEIDKSERALFKIQHKGKNNSLYNFAYRFRRGKIEQVDSSIVLPIGDKNRLVARWNYSLDSNKTIEAIAGFEHKNCCWAARLVARRYVYNEAGDVNNGIFFELQLNGLGAIGRNPRRLLQQSILGYSEEF